MGWATEVEDEEGGKLKGKWKFEEVEGLGEDEGEGEDEVRGLVEGEGEGEGVDFVLEVDLIEGDAEEFTEGADKGTSFALFLLPLLPPSNSTPKRVMGSSGAAAARKRSSIRDNRRPVRHNYYLRCN